VLQRVAVPATRDDLEAERPGAQGRVEYLRTHVNQLRRKLEAAQARVEIVTEAGVGYRLITTLP
jgi:DNA-binding response OmpR family regulator